MLASKQQAKAAHHVLSAGKKRATSHDGCPATEATLYQPSGVAVDSASNGYIADTYLNLVRNVAPNGISSVVASVIQGTYIYPGYNGDNSPATSAAQASTT